MNSIKEIKMLVDTVTEYTFTEAFRQVRPENFSDEGLRALYQ